MRLWKGILSIGEQKQRADISQETKQTVLTFYKSEEISRLLSGKKDCVSIRLQDKTKIKKQKQLLLSNISEIYAQFKKENPDRKICFSTFALLCLKWYIPVGATGILNICICNYHQNVKLMLVAMNSSSNYRQMMRLCACDVDKFDCTMGHCDNCLDLSVLKSFLRKELLKIINPDETIRFSQWVNTDRSQLVEEESEFDDFIENLVGKFGKLTKHHYVAKKQAEFFK